jgi:multicomponent K+:H+ antiporter subunit A
VFILLRGHNQPGGGFIAGLVLAVALSLQAMAQGLDSLAPLRPALHPLLSGGLAVAAATGAAAFVFAHPFLTSASGHPVLPLVGAVPLASALLFDLGVWLVVGAAMLLVLTGLGRAGRRR